MGVKGKLFRERTQPCGQGYQRSKSDVSFDTHPPVGDA